jgi:adenosylcobinamide kinase/adenosylcobinamide-phosphate guanylyltransferase
MDSARSVMLVLGGVRSGKSRHAQAEASRFAKVTFVATAQRSDTEMRRKIAVHRRERPRDWKTVEAQTNLHQIVPGAHSPARRHENPGSTTRQG